jgi:hypothetical protein
MSEMEKAHVMIKYGFSDIKEDLKIEDKLQKSTPLISNENILRINAIQELFFLEEDNALTLNEVLEHVLKFYQKFVPY